MKTEYTSHCQNECTSSSRTTSCVSTVFARKRESSYFSFCSRTNLIGYNVICIITLIAITKFRLTANHELLDRLLTCIEDEIIPQTETGVSQGNKVFGAAILLDDSDDAGDTKQAQKWPLVIARSNAELTKCPLYHGEVHCIHAYGTELSPQDKPRPDQCIFLSTHEPCCMCISSIVWSGFQKVYYLFGYQETKDQGIRKFFVLTLFLSSVFQRVTSHINENVV